MSGALARFFRMVTFPELREGLGITFKWLARPKVTECYPDERITLPYRTKGRIHVDIETCISCKICEKACPEGCIKVIPPPKEVFKTDKRPAAFYMSLDHCLFCGLCVDPCPTASIHHSSEWETASYHFNDFLFDKESLPCDLKVRRYREGFWGNVVAEDSKE